MADEAHPPKDTTEQKPANAGDASTSTTTTPAAAAPAGQAAAGQGSSTPVVDVTRVPTRKLIGDEDEIPSDAEILEIPARALKQRLARFTRAQLREHFGTDNPDDIKAKLAKLDGYEKDAEEKRLAQLSETERYKEQLAKAEERATVAERRAEELHERQVVSRVERTVQKTASKYVEDDALEFANERLKKFIRECSPEELTNESEVIEEFFKTFAERHPRLAKGTPQTPAAEAKADPAEVQQVGMNTASGAKPDNTKSIAAWAGKTFAPNRPNSMSHQEWLDYKHAHNI